MRGPGATAAARGTAGFEAEPVQGVSRASSGAPAAPSPTAVAPLSAAQAGRVVAPVPARTRDLPCRNDPDLFFAESPADVECAKVLCGGCAVRPACLSGALDRHEPWGVWGGELFLRGEVVPRKRPRGRPRKTDIAA